MRILLVVGIAALVTLVAARPNRYSNKELESVKSLLEMLTQSKRQPQNKVRSNEDVYSADSIQAALLKWEQENGIDPATYKGPSKKSSIIGKKGSSKSKSNDKKALDSPPHVIYFLIDDLGFNDVSWNNPEVQTPNLKKLAEQGMILDQAYAQAICSPSRGALMTGMYPFHTGMQHDVIQWTSPECGPANFEYLPEKLKTAGYSTHMLGKWHLGFCKEACTPTARGFDTFFGFYQGFIDHYTHMTGAAGHEGYDWRDGLDARKDLDGQYAGTLITDRAVEIITNYNDASQPMFMYVAHSGVHAPIQAPQEFLNPYLNTGMDADRAAYLAMVSQVDDTVGQVVAALKARGLYDNSVIIFQSDNGGEYGSGASNFPLRGSKTSIYEAGTRVPAMFHSPLASADAINVRVQDLFHITDWHATILSFAFAGEDATGLDGKDQSGLLLYGEDGEREEMVYNIDSNFPQLFGEGGIRKGDWKLIIGYPGLYDGWEGDSQFYLGLTSDVDWMRQHENFNKRSSKKSVSKKGDYNFDFGAIMTYIGSTQTVVQLFNLADDPNERNNLASSNPEVVEELTLLLDSYKDTEVAIDTSAQIADPAGEASNYGGVWSPGWC
jgi:arylsulfatase B